jgi:hypothetical protein
LRVELVQAEQLTLLRCLVRQHGLRHVLSKSLTPEAMADLRERLAEVRELDAGLARLHQQWAELVAAAEEIDQGIAEITRGRQRMLLEYGAAAALALDRRLDVLPLKDEKLLDATAPFRPDGTAQAHAGATAARHDA